jgi:DNA-binding protein HU-beta
MSVAWVAVRFRPAPAPDEEVTLTKAEFVDRLAGDGRIGSKKQAGEVVEAMLDGIADALAAGDSVNFTGFGKFSVAERGPRQGVNPRTGERITIAGGRVPKFSAGAGLKARVKG